jgi:exopolyphosphatase/pppGpp-phosphohydrolase
MFAYRLRRIALAPLLALLAGAADAAPGGESVSAPTCAIDMGSNSFKRIVGRSAGGRYEQLAFEKKTLGVGDDLSRHGRISDAKLAEIEATLAEFARACAKDGAGRVVAVGTAAFRDAPNGASVVALAAKLGIPMEIASERRESELAYLVGSLGADGLAVIDNGSRSIELVSREAGGEARYAVLPLGYRIAWAEFFANATDPAAAIRAFRARLEPEAAKAAPFLRGRAKLVGVEFEEMAELLFGVDEVEGHAFGAGELAHRLDEIASGGPAAFAALKQKADIDRALPRLVVAATLTPAYGYERLELTARELGTGLIIEAGLATR